MITLWNTLFYTPLYNALVFLVHVLPQHSLFIAVIILTIIVRIIISPLSYKALKTQMNTKALQPKINKIKETISDKQEQARATLELYREHGVNPFSTIFLILIQAPIVIALYSVFREGIDIDPSLLYSFVQNPETINITQFGINLSKRSYLLAFLTGLTQYIHLSRSASFKSMNTNEPKTQQEEMMQMVGKSMKYTMPFIFTVISFLAGAALSLYWVTSNIFMIIQETFIQKRLSRKKQAE